MSFRIALLTYCLFMLSSCKVSKFLEQDEILLKSIDIEFSSKESLEETKELKNTIQDKLYPIPNKKFLGLFYTKLWLHEKVKPKEDREKGLKHWLKNKVGEKPVLVGDVNLALMVRIIEKTMLDNGYFNAEVKSNVSVDQKKGTISYSITPKTQTTIDSIIFPQDSSALSQLIREFKDYQTKENKAYKLQNLQSDREALATAIRSEGYYDFGEQDIYYVIDTAVGDSRANVYFKVNKPSDTSSHHKYYIQDVVVHATYMTDNEIPQEAIAQDFYYKDFRFIQDYKFVGKKALQSNILIRPDEQFSVEDYNFTIARLNDLEVYNFVNINYQKAGVDSLIVDVFLTPGKHQNVNVDVDASTSNRSFLGSSLSLGYQNKNLFHGAERLELKASAGTEFQFVNDRVALNILSVDFKASLTLPRILFLLKQGKIRSGKIPSTSLNFEESYQQWLQYYSLNSFNVNYKYNWFTKKNHHHVLTPLFVNFINLLNTTSEFDDILQSNPNLRESFSNQVIIGSNYGYTVNTQESRKDNSYVIFDGFVENAGGFSYLIASAFKRDKQKPYKVLGIPFAQYTKITAELKHYWQLNSNSSFVSRLASGVGVAYGNAENLPYVKQFFMGGPNTIRAFPFRSLGPGAFSSAKRDDNNPINPIQQAGDIKLLMNAEYRYTIYKFIKGAVFLDAGNVWLLREDADRPNSQFQWDQFYKQIALGTGVGLRLDFDFFAIRADLGIPLYKPYAVSGERWIHEYPEQGFKAWRKENWAWNIAIGYPF